ncbi:hypothetical protein SHLO109777_12915 [Shewanella loihica]|uniref:Uncharacterized protein n=1 Tax=Shewanella loihica (strain ATCC BAA-1088 / PV-4) TaxID=323850 RepID=A3QA05_SHELP|nr:MULTISPECIES: hypothetical protein [Shewanella]ABO22303.1 conserved hypothetical protein [Shewanella loihica PV-4]QYJ98085.1 hypothetical protein K0J45_02210 [Shewanella alkalitolerans]QYK13353.1 hypothetical protein K0I63_02195 [Shewanella rhizosphaerae]
MNRPSPSILLLIALYIVIAILAGWRALDSQTLDLFTLGVIPVLIGLIARTSWASLVLKIYIGIQTLGFTALGATAVIAYQITPEDVKVVVRGQELPIWAIALVVTALLSFQWYMAFSKGLKQYLPQAAQTSDQTKA